MDANVQAYCTTLKDLVGDEDPLDILSRTPARIRTLISGVGAAALSRQPSPGKWSVTEIIAHLADAELVFGYRLRMMFTAPGVRLQAFNPDRFASTFDYTSCEAHTSAERFTSSRTGTLGMLRRVAPALMDNAGRHEEWGTETVRGLVRLEAGHDKNHLAQIERLLARVGVTPAFIPSAQKPEIPVDVAERVDLRIGTIVDIVEVPEADRLMKLSVDFGADTRTVIAGIRDERS